MVAVSPIVVGFVAGFAIGTLGEYWIHRGMHKKLIFARNHSEHHREGAGHGALKEFRDYSLGALIATSVCALLWYFHLLASPVASGLVIGFLTHAIFAAWCHQAQHEDPRLVRWLSRTPIHFVHHTLNQTRHNFGISVDWWDHVFGTYEPEPNWRALLEPNLPVRSWWQINWLDRHHSAQR